jgi:hypothetical protein
VPARTLKEELLRLETRQDELRELLARPEPGRTLIHPALAEIYRCKVAALHEALEDEATREEAMELIRSLIETIVLVPDDGSLRIEVRGELATILAIGEGRKNPALWTGISPSKLRWLRGLATILIYSSQPRSARRLGDVRFTPKSGHSIETVMSVKCQ